ncbi:hypothetical protein CMQ_2158 [Grosmannia clavigera kw1407]|uniref:Uncharacterized protein n=1 Tax=Grosmannia clavigera (strain kw1407 / UAMH 11150) TaxID=655863 RepID=F0XJR3_GROCL|nr:uncharacterized protein CMQ_2158 [Grosmannia clavigera kw1407]EFX02109.1 hypothetical protein CMQ_2158 [Grosmannia clavigera kw1407]
MRPRREDTFVPRTDQVVPGASVHIVLKQDQPTGRTVQGTVQTLLTRGNHPRGIKVRLSDGRVGRVQTMADGAATTSQGTSSFGHATGSSILDNTVGNNEDNMPKEQIGLDAYIIPARPKQKGRRGNAEDQGIIIQGESVEPSNNMQTGGRTELPSSSPSVTCPVCGTFEGDEAAVSHHVATHFDTEQ